MAKLPSFPRLKKTDFAPEFQGLIEQLSYTVNNGLEALTNAVSGNLGTENLDVSVKTVTLTVDSSGTPIGGASFSVDSTTSILGLRVIKAVNLTNAIVYPTGQPFISYTQSGNRITINNITGLPANYRFTLTVVAELS